MNKKMDDVFFVLFLNPFLRHKSNIYLRPKKQIHVDIKSIHFNVFTLKANEKFVLI